MVTVPKENIDELNKNINDLMAIENDINILKISIDELGDNQLSIEDVEDLLPMIE